MKKIVVLYGQSGSGKSALKNAIMQLRPDYNNVVTSTTRPMREGEQNGVDYFYYSDEEMANKIMDGEMAECVVFNDWVYGTEYGKLIEDKINIGVWNPEGVESLNDDYDLECLNIYVDASAKVRMIRSLNREENPNVDEIVRRYEADRKDFRDMDINFYMTINNDGSRPIEEVAAEVIRITDRGLGRFV